MKKRILALLLCLTMLVPCLASCAEPDLDYTGAYIQMYLSQQIYDFDPLYAFNNEAQLKVVGLIFTGLFKIDSKGKVQNDLVKKCEIIENPNTNEYKMILTLNETKWSDGLPVDGDDVVYAIKRALRTETSCEAAALLMDIKNARDVKAGNNSIDKLGISSPNAQRVEITFEGAIDYEQFKYNLASPALVPLREDIVDRNTDWAKKPASMTCSGPFMIRKVSYEEASKKLVLERNSYYYRDTAKDETDEFVKPYRIVIDYTKTADEQMQMFENGQVFYVGDIALAYRGLYAKDAVVTDALSTHTYYLNENRLVSSSKAGEENGFALFAVPEVRKALSLAIDRQAIANQVVFAKAATGLIPLGIFETDSAKETFRSAGTDLLSASADKAAAQALLSSAGITPSDYTFTISYRDGDEVHAAIANTVALSWIDLGFNVGLTPLGVEEKGEDEVDPSTGERQTDIRDDLFNEALVASNYDVIALDLVATSTSAFSMLAPFALKFTGNLLRMDSDLDEYPLEPHKTGYHSDSYDALIESAFNAKNLEDRAVILHQAEAALLDDMPVIPIIFNQDAYLQSKQLKKVSSSYYGFAEFKKTELKNWDEYLITYRWDEF